MACYLRKVIFYLSNPYVLASCILLLEKCTEAGISVDILTADEIEEQKDYPRKDTLYISDEVKCVNILLEKKLAVLVLSHEKNRNQDFSQCSYAMENPQDIDAEYLERIYRRCTDLPWDILETHRCALRETVVEDVDAFWEMYTHPSLTRYTEGLYPTIEEEKSYISDYIMHAYRFYEFGVWTVLHKESGIILGRAGLSVRDGYDIPELGYVIGCEYQRKGYAYEVCLGILQYAGEYLGFRQVGAVVHRENRASILLLEKLGFQYVKAHDDTMDYYVGDTSTK